MTTSSNLDKQLEALVEEQQHQQPRDPTKYLMPEKPTEGCKLPNRNYWFKILEDDMVKQVSVPFENINDIVETTSATATKGDDDDDDDEQQEKQKATTTITKLDQVLDEFGFAIIPNVLDSAFEIERAKSLFAQDLLATLAKPPMSDPEKFAEVAADPITNWPTSNASLGHTFCSNFGLPHGRCAWHCRLHPKIRKVFASLYRNNETGEEESDLCSGMDNLFFNNLPCETAPWEMEKTIKKAEDTKKGDDDTKNNNNNADADKNETKEENDEEYDEARMLANNYGERLWPHCDQNMQETPVGLYRMFQSALYIDSSENENTSTTIVWPRSHREIAEKMFYEKKFICGHYVPLPNQYSSSFIRNCRRVPVPAGGLLIWNSRTIHQGWNAGPRLAVPICLEPKSRRDAKALERKISMVRTGGPSTHSASQGHRHDLGFSDKPRDADGLIILHRAHQYLFKNGGEIPKEIMEML